MNHQYRSFASLILFLSLVSPLRSSSPDVEVVDAPDALKPTAAAIVGVTADGRAARSPVRAFWHDPVTLHAVLRGREDGHDIAVTDAEVIAAGAVPWDVPARPWSHAEEARLVWYKVEPRARNFFNTELPSMHFSWKKVPYGETVTRRGHGTLVADAKPTTYAGNQRGYGTMRFKLEYRKGDVKVATPGADTMQPTKQDALFRVSYAGVTQYPLINAALELCNVPYVFGSESPTQKDADHQSEWAYGVDCADLVSYAIRHAGISFPYGFTGTFDPEQGRTTKVVRPAGDTVNGVYVDAAGKPIKWGPGGVQPQDLILFDGATRHIGILYKDRPPLGVLDENDLIVHTLCEAPTFIKVSEAWDKPFSVVRLKKATPPVLAAAPTPVPRAQLTVAKK